MLNSVEESTKLFLENYGLIFKFFATEMPGKKISDEDIGQLRIELWKASLSYDKDMKNTFSTFAFTFMRNCYKRYWAKLYRYKHKSNLNNSYLDDPDNFQIDNNIYNAWVSGENDFTKSFDTESAISNFHTKAKSLLTDREYYIYQNLLNNKTYEEIGNALGVTRQRVMSIVKHNIRRKLSPYKKMLV